MLGMGDMAEFRVSHQYSDLHVRWDVFEQTAERPRLVMLSVPQGQNWLMTLAIFKLGHLPEGFP